MCILLHLAAAVADIRVARGAFEPTHWLADTIVANLLLVHGLHVFDFPTWNWPSWTISTEFYTYFLLALAVLALRERISHLLVAIVLASPVALWLLVGHMDTTYD
jgi:peptidoglycan/LPS O-acetylase OafA/YrhL